MSCSVELSAMLHKDATTERAPFGLGCDLQAPGAMASGLRGTPLYMAPELFDGAPSSASSDIYSLGVSLFHLVSGTYAVSAGTRESTSPRDGA